jgi:hypothetical protein
MKKQNAHLRPRRRAEQDEPREQRENRCSGSRPHSMEGKKTRGGRRREKKQLEKKDQESERATKLFEVLFRKKSSPIVLSRKQSDRSLTVSHSPPAMSLLRPSRGPCGPRRALRLQSSVVAVHRRATTPSRERKPRPSSSSSSSTAATAATPTSTQSTSTEPPPQAAPPADFDLRSSLVPQTRAIISERWPELLDLVDDGTLVAVARPEDYRERRSDGYSEPQLVLLVAAAHISRASASAATRVVEAVKPDAVVLELCGSRKSVLAEEEGEEEVSSSSSSSPSFRSADKGRKASNPFALSGSIARSASLGGAPAMALRLLLARQSDAVLEAAMENESEGDETSTPSPSLSSAFSRRPGVEARAAAAGALLVVRLLVLVLPFFERKRRASLPPPKKKVAASSDAGSAQRSFF